MRGFRSARPVVVLLIGLAFFLGFPSLPIVPRVRADSTSYSPDVQVKVPDKVEAKCVITVETKGIPPVYSISFECKFTNKDANNAKDFLFCSMTDLLNDLKEAFGGGKNPLPGVTGQVYLLEYNKTNNAITCATGPTWTSTSRTSSFHFGCQRIMLAKAGTVVNGKPTDTLTINVPASAYKSPVLKNNAGVARLTKADDFRIGYFDTFDLSAPPGVTFSGCDGTKGQANFVCLKVECSSHIPAGSPAIMSTFPGAAEWTANSEAYKSDPYVSFQSTTQGALYDNMPCLPSGFPQAVTYLPVCPSSTLAPVSNELELWYHGTMNAVNGTVFPSFLNFTTSGSTSGLSVQTFPAPDQRFDMFGQQELYGNVTLCASSSPPCSPPIVQEGRQLNVTVNVYNATSSAFLFSEDMSFIQDTVPPLIGTNSTSFDRFGNLQVNVAATDLTTSPVAGTLWFSTDGGSTWDETGMLSLTDLLQQSTTRTFAGMAGPFLAGTTILYFMSIQDVVGNIAYSGVGRLDVQPAVGGSVIPVNNLVLLAPYLLTASVLVLATLATIVSKGRRERRRKVG